MEVIRSPLSARKMANSPIQSRFAATLVCNCNYNIVLKHCPIIGEHIVIARSKDYDYASPKKHVCHFLQTLVPDWCMKLWRFINYSAVIIPCRVRTSRFYPPGQPAVDSTYRTHFLSYQGQPSIRVPLGTSPASRNNNPHPHNMEQVFGHPNKVRAGQISDQNMTS